MRPQMRSHFYDMDYIERKDLIIKMSKLSDIMHIPRPIPATPLTVFCVNAFTAIQDKHR